MCRQRRCGRAATRSITGVIGSIDPQGTFALVATLATLSLAAYVQTEYVSSLSGRVRANSGVFSLFAQWTEYTVTYIRDGQQVGGPLALETSFGLTGDKGDLRPIVAFVGTALLNDAQGRAWYMNVSEQLPSEVGYNATRDFFKISASRRTTPVGKAFVKSFNAARGESDFAIRTGRANVTNQSVNAEALRFWRPVGLTLVVIGAGVSIYNIATADDVYRQFAVEGGLWAGALSGGYVGAEIGASVGLAFPPWGPFVGAIAGGIIGSFIGGNAGAIAGGNYYDFFVPVPQGVGH
jgi:hypothetical protein